MNELLYRPPGPPGSSTLSVDVCDRIKHDVLTLRFEPGTKLQVGTLSQIYKTSQTPVREALSRLSAEGVVESHDRRGFFVPNVSEEELEGLTKARCLVECAALKASMACATPQWEEQLLVAHYRVSMTPRSLNEVYFVDNPEWEALHRAFHRLLIANCGSRQIVAFCDRLVDQLYRYRLLSVRRAFTPLGKDGEDARSSAAPHPHKDAYKLRDAHLKRTADEHKAILDLVLNKDVDRACAMLNDHLAQTSNKLVKDDDIFQTRPS